MTVSLPVWHSHCIRARFTVVVSCNDGWACSLLMSAPSPAEVGCTHMSGLFYRQSLLRNNNVAPNLQRFTLRWYAFCRIWLLNTDIFGRKCNETVIRHFPYGSEGQSVLWTCICIASSATWKGQAKCQRCPSGKISADAPAQCCWSVEGSAFILGSRHRCESACNQFKTTNLRQHQSHQ